MECLDLYGFPIYTRVYPRSRQSVSFKATHTPLSRTLKLEDTELHIIIFLYQVVYCPGKLTEHVGITKSEDKKDMLSSLPPLFVSRSRKWQR